MLAYDTSIFPLCQHLFSDFLRFFRDLYFVVSSIEIPLPVALLGRIRLRGTLTRLGGYIIRPYSAQRTSSLFLIPYSLPTAVTGNGAVGGGAVGIGGLLGRI